MKKILFLILTSIILICCKEQNDKFSLQNVKFQSIFGASKENPKQVFCLLGNGYFLAEHSENADSLINNWTMAHPNAKVNPVSSSEMMTYCWLVDGKDNLNTYLVKNGCFAGGNMRRPQTYDEMSPKMKKIYTKNYKLIVHIEKAEYDAFIEQIEKAETYAKKEKLGIWSKTVNDDE